MSRTFFKIFTGATIMLLGQGALLNAQVTIGENKPPESFSLLELVGDGTNGFRLPQMTTEQRETMSNAAFKASERSMGLQIFNTSTHCVETWNGSAWIEDCAPEPDYVDVTCEGVTIRWARCNVDRPGTFAAKPTDTGMFYQWNTNVGWSATYPMVSTNNGISWHTAIPPGNTWESQKDPCPEGWRVPKRSELMSLGDCYDFITNYKKTGVNVGRFGYYPNQIYLPAPGYRSPTDGALIAEGTDGLYWSSTESPMSNSTFAYYLLVKAGYGTVHNYQKTYGMLVRCVAEQ